MNILWIFIIVAVSFIAIGFISGLYIWVNSLSLENYLKKFKYERWRHLTSIKFIGPGQSNPIGWLRYIYGPEDNDDAIVLRRKDKIRIALPYMLTGFGAAFVVFGLTYFYLTRFHNR